MPTTTDEPGSPATLERLRVHEAELELRRAAGDYQPPDIPRLRAEAREERALRAAERLADAAERIAAALERGPRLTPTLEDF